VAGAVAVGALFLSRDADSNSAGPHSTPTPSATPSASATPADDFSPHTGIPVVDQVIDIVRSGDLAGFRALMKEFPDRCTTGIRGVGSPPACPPGAADGSPVEAFRALASERADPGPDLDQLLANVVPKYTTLHGVATAQPDAWNGFFPAWKYEVIAYGPAAGGGQGWAFYLLDDTGIVGVYVPEGFGGADRHNAVRSEDWLVAPYSRVLFEPQKDVYVIGRDSQVTLFAQLPEGCTGKPVAVRLYTFTPVGSDGGIQEIKEPGLAMEARAVAGKSATSIDFRLPDSIPGPMVVRLGLLSPCLSQIAVQGGLNLALLAPPADANVATFEILGERLDYASPRGGPNGSVQSDAEYWGGELTAAVDGYACGTVSLVDPAARNSRGNVVFRVGLDSQPAACRAPGHSVNFVATAFRDGEYFLWGEFEFVPGVVQLVRNIGPRPPDTPAPPPLIYE
jgi:hypothetical protein